VEVIFRGGEADRHQLELYNGSEALAGLGRVGNLVAHYAATREIRFRAPYSNLVEFALVGTDEGSFKVIIDEVSRLAGEAANARVVQLAGSLFRRVIERATGQAENGPLVVGGEQISAADIDVLSEAATPALERAHRWINQGGKTITVDPTGARPVALNENTKDYLDSENVEQRRSDQDVSVSALNVNSRYGRVFFPDLGRTVPFKVPRDAAGRTMTMLSRYLVRYAERERHNNNNPINVHIEFRRVHHIDGRLKRVIIYDCYPIEDAA
jgi:hypothetical protein